MKKLTLTLLSVFFAFQINAQLNLGSIIEKVTGSSSSEGTSSAISNTIGSILGDIVADNDVEVSQLVGEWKYESPAVSFQSDDILKQVGGSAASSTIESELSTYYKKAGFNKLNLTIDSESNFSMKTKYATLKGTVEKGENGIMIFNFNAFGSFKIASINAYTKLSGSTLSLTFDVNKLIDLIKTVSNYTKMSTIQTVISIVDSYDGITMGFKLKKQ